MTDMSSLTLIKRRNYG